MTPREAVEKLLRAYQPYYNVKREDVTPPFAAEAEFRSHEAQYFLVRKAVISEAESNEYVFFAAEDVLSAERLRTLDAAAWNAGTARVRPHKNHRNSDVTLIVCAGRVEPDAAALIPKLKRYQSYRWGFQGWSHYRLAVAETDAGRVACNRQGRALRALLRRNLGL